MRNVAGIWTPKDAISSCGHDISAAILSAIPSTIEIGGSVMGTQRWSAVGRMLAILCLFVALTHLAIAQSEPKQAQKLEQSGDLKGAVEGYTAALQKVRPGSAQDKQLREKIIDLMLKLDPKPTLPEEAVKHGVRGETLAKVAQTDADRSQAAVEYRVALKLAPWWADVYLNYGIIEEAMRQPAEAAWAYTFYLRAAPDAPDRRSIQDRIYAQEALAEKTTQTRAVAKSALGSSNEAASTPSHTPIDPLAVEVANARRMAQQEIQKAREAAKRAEDAVARAQSAAAEARAGAPGYFTCRVPDTNEDAGEGTCGDHEGYVVSKATRSISVSYAGEYHNDFPNGYGVIDYGGGELYEGEIERGWPVGYGVKSDPRNGVTEEGKFTVNGLTGYGVTWHQGDRYEGTMRDGSREGPGWEQWSNGQIFAGVWHEGILVTALKINKVRGSPP